MYQNDVFLMLPLDVRFRTNATIVVEKDYKLFRALLYNCETNNDEHIAGDFLWVC